MTAIEAPPLRHEAVRASAGSGKTHRLSSRYIAIVDRDEPPARIIASTFTRAAAGEILDRVLHRLASAVASEGARLALGASIDRPDLSADRALVLLRRLVGALHRLQIRTLDSFFAAIVQACAFEIGVAPGTRILEEHEEAPLRRAALRDTLAGVGADRLVDTLRAWTEGRAGRAVALDLDRTVAALDEATRAWPASAWTWMAPRRGLDARGLAAAQAALAAVAPAGRAAKAHAKAIEIARGAAPDDAVAWSAFVSGGLAAKLAAGDADFAGAPIDAAVRAAYEPLVEHARAVIWNHVAWRTRSTHEMLSRFRAAQASLKGERRVVAFRDLTTLARAALASDSAEEILFRIDAGLGHLLLDEFQDTSAEQWEVLEPLARAVVSEEGRSFFCVGDVKQSLYGWRGAEPEVIEHVADLLRPSGRPSAIHESSLDVSRRSSAEIVEAVNAVFGRIDRHAELRKRSEAAIAFWASAFRPHATAATEPGCAELREVVTAEGAAKDARFAAAARLAAMLAERAGNVGILLRTNDDVGRMLFELGARAGVPASGRGGGSLIDSAPVTAILDLLRLADHPDHTVAAFHVARGPLGPVVGLAPDAHRDRAVRHRAARAVRRALAQTGYAESIRAWACAVAPGVERAEMRRLRQLVDLAGRHDRDPALRPSLLAEHAALLRLDERAADAGGAGSIEVMNVHQAKGLEWDAVILPDLAWTIGDLGGAQITFERDRPGGPVARAVRWVNKSMQDALPELRDLFSAERTRRVREGLSVLYVAMTRARRGLFMLVSPEDRGAASAAGVVCAGLLGAAASGPRPVEAPARAGADDRVLWRSGSLEALPRRDGAAAAPDRPTVPALAAIRSRGSAFRGRPPVERAPAIEEALRLPDEDAIDRGVALHALFEGIEWLEDLAADDAPLAAIARRAVPRRDEAWAREIAGAFRAALRRPAIAAALARPAPGDGATVVFRERAFAFVEGATGDLRRGRIDRLVVRLDADGRPRAATVIDFKTELVEGGPREVQAAAERYREQLGTYRIAAARLAGLPVECVECVLLFVPAGARVILGDRNREPA